MVNDWSMTTNGGRQLDLDQLIRKTERAHGLIWGNLAQRKRKSEERGVLNAQCDVIVVIGNHL